MTRDDIILNAFLSEIDGLNKEAMKKGTVAGLGMAALAPLLAACPKGEPCPSSPPPVEAKAEPSKAAPAKAAPEGRSRADVESEMKIKRQLQENWPRGYPFNYGRKSGLSEDEARRIAEDVKAGKPGFASDEAIASFIKDETRSLEEKKSWLAMKRAKEVVAPLHPKKPAAKPSLFRGMPRGK